MVILEDTLKQVKRLPTLRVNTLKSTLLQIEENLRTAHIAYELCSILPHSIILKNYSDEKKLRSLDIYKNGEIYLQGISSQIPVHYFTHPHNTSQGSPLPGEMKQQIRILDACAAPWGKTSQLAEMFPHAEIWAFESSKIRHEKMLYNFKKLGISTLDTSHNPPLPQVICIHDNIENIWKYINNPFLLSEERIQGRAMGEKKEKSLEYFDMILVDAPCSWEGSLTYHNTKFLENWSLSHIKKNYARQKAICDTVLPYLKTGWEMIYSTCTLAPEENEAVIHYLLCKYPELSLEKLDIIDNKYIKYKEALKSFWKNIFRKKVVECTLRVTPSKFSEWFYIAKFKKWIE